MSSPWIAVLAQHERRVKAALAAAKRRGVRLGNPRHLDQKARQKGTTTSAVIRRAMARQRAMDLAPTIEELRDDGAVSLHELARGLNQRGIPAPRGGEWMAVQIKRLPSRLAAEVTTQPRRTR